MTNVQFNTPRGLCLPLLLLLLQAMLLPLAAETIYVVNSQSRTLSRIDTLTDVVQNSFAQLGNIPNKVVVDEDYLWCVNSGDNSVQKLNRETGALLANILVGIGSNPWDALLHEGYLYVTGLFTNKVYRINTQTGLVQGNVNVGFAPEALCVLNSKLYVSNVGNYAQDYAGSSISVIDLDTFSVTKNLPVPANPQYLTSHNGLLHVSCTGNWTTVAGAVCIIDPVTDSISQTISLGGTPGGIWINSQNLAFVADSNGQNLYRYNALDFSILNGADNPLSNGGSEIAGNSTMLAVLSPNWGSNGTVKLFYPDLSIWKQYTVGMVPTDLKLAGSSSSAWDENISPVHLLTAYPNPVNAGEILLFSSAKPLKTELKLYNLKGQRVLSLPFTGDKLSIPTRGLGSGVYFYKVTGRQQSGKALANGKIIVLRN